MGYPKRSVVNATQAFSHHAMNRYLPPRSLVPFPHNHHNSTTPPAPAAATTHAITPGAVLPKKTPAFVVAAAGALPVPLAPGVCVPLPLPLPPIAADDADGITVSVTPIVMGI